MVPAQRPWSTTADKSQRARSRDKRELVEVLDAITSPRAERGERESALAGARIAGPPRTNDRPGERHLRIAGGHVARVCGYQGRTEATLQQRLTPLSARLSHGVPPQVPIGVRPVDGAAR